MSFTPHSYGAAAGGTERSLQRTTRPSPWEHYTSSGNLDSQKIYGTKAEVLAAYEAAAAAAGPRDIVTLTAQTDGGSRLGPMTHEERISCAAAVDAGGTSTRDCRALVFRTANFDDFSLANGAILLDVPQTILGWAWYGADGELTDDTPLTHLVDVTLNPSGSLELAKVESTAYDLIILAPRVSPGPATFGELLAHTPVVNVGSYGAANPRAFGAWLAGGTSGVPLYRVIVGGPHLGGTVNYSDTLVVPCEGGGTLTSLSLGFDYSGGALLRTNEAQAGTTVTFFEGRAAGLSIPLPSPAKLIITLESTEAFPTTGEHTQAVPAEDVEVIMVGPSEYRSVAALAAAVSITVAVQDALRSTYTGTITTTTYIPEPTAELTAEGTPRPSSVVTMQTTRGFETITENQQDGWTAMQKLAYQAAYSNQDSFVVFGTWHKVSEYLSLSDLALLEDYTHSVLVLTATYTWFSTSPSGDEEPPGVTPLYPYKGTGAVTELTGYDRPWYQHSLTYTNR